MKPLDQLVHHPESEKLVNILCQRTQNSNPLFFRVLVAYYWGIVASMMRTSVVSPEKKKVPVNVYTINLAPSGSGKGYSSSIMEDEVINLFKEEFINRTFPVLAAKNIAELSLERVQRKGTEDPDVELLRTEKEFTDQGPLVFSFDSATTPAIKQARHKLLMAKAGSLNLQIDEIASNLLSNSEILTAYLELFDLGKIKQKLIKNTGEATRTEEIYGHCPANMMLFGTPSRLLNGGRAEEELYAMLDEGYARRCFFGYIKTHDRSSRKTAQELLQEKSNPSTHNYIETLSNKLGALADTCFAHTSLTMSDEVALILIEYQVNCQDRADLLGEHEEMKKAELCHRHFKVMKLAGAYAFIDGHKIITEDYIYYAIKLAEDSGEAFHQLLTRDRPYIKLAKYIADIKRDVTEADLVEDLPFYKGSIAQKQEMLNLAIAYGYQNNILIRQLYLDGVKFLKGETLEATDTNKILLSWSTDIAVNYQKQEAKFEDLHLLTQVDGMHWCNHAFTDGHRLDDHAIPGFNILVLDIDGGIDVNVALTLLKQYKLMIYTTKRHTDTDHRFRIIIPTNYVLKLDSKDYKDFINNLMETLPFEIDPYTGQRNRKWLSNAGHYMYQDGELFDVLPLIPKTSKNEKRKQLLDDQSSMDNLERWVINNSGDGNRNNMVLRYALILVDIGFDLATIQEKTLALNSKLPNKLEDSEILQTIMKTVARRSPK